MSFWRRAELACLLLALLATSACIRSVQRATLTLEQHSLRMLLHVGRDGSIFLSDQPPLTGRLDLKPILKAEGISLTPQKPVTVQGMIYYSRLYLIGDGFRSLWEITPKPGTSKGAYRPIPLAAPAARVQSVRLSRYGSSRSSCLRIDRTDGAPAFINSRGNLSHDCS